MRNLQKPTMILLMICLVMTMLISPASNVQAAKKKIANVRCRSGF